MTQSHDQETRTMFFRMIKRDLKESRGLNVIIVLFMVLVSALVTSSALLFLANFRGVRVSQERCKPYDAVVIYYRTLADKDEQVRRMEGIITEKYPDAEFENLEGIEFDYTNIDYDGIDKQKLSQSGFQNTNHILTKQPRNRNLIYDVDNKPFHVENGKIAVPYSYAVEVDLKVGETFAVTAPNGRKFVFEISHITRDPISTNLERFIISDGDYEKMSQESPQKLGILGINTSSGLGQNDERIIETALTKDNDYKDFYRIIHLDGHVYSDSALISKLVTVFLLITCIFMIIIVLFTIGFTIRSVIKKEERELGIMKALGTDSVSFRWLVAAKYIAFAIVGGAIGAVIGIPMGNVLIGRFYYNISYSISVFDYAAAILGAVFIIMLVILFIYHSMKRINKISVMDVLHGEARLERIKHSDRFQLNKRRKMNIPLFLALSDIFGNFKRYILLFVAFTLGSLVVVTNIQIRESVISTDFLYKFYTFKHFDLVTWFNNTSYNELTDGTDRGDLFQKNFDVLMKREGIPATLELSYNTNAQLVDGDKVSGMKINFGFDPEGLVIRDGGQVPKLRNEILIDYYTAVEHGVKIGDEVTIRYDKYTEDRLSTVETDETFIITGYIDRLTKFNSTEVIMSPEFNDAPKESFQALGFTINAPQSEHQVYIEKLEKIFPDQCVSDKQLIAGILGMYDVLFSFLRNMMWIVVTGVLGFLVVMYQTIFMKDEEQEIALLGSAGFDERSTKGWQFLRMMIIFIAAIILSIVLAPAAAMILGKLFNLMLGITGFRFTRGYLLSAIWAVFIALFIAVVMILILRRIRNIEIWRIRNE